MKKFTAQLEALTCPSCIQNIETVLGKQKGVIEAKVWFNASKVKVYYDESMLGAADLVTIIEGMGYPVLSSK